MGRRRRAAPGARRGDDIRLRTWGLAAALWVGIVVVVIILVGIRSGHIATTGSRDRTTPVYDPPVLAGQPLFHECSGGFYARRGDTIVLTSTGHCTAEGTIATDPDGIGVRGVFGPSAKAATCDHPGKTCAASDMTYIVVADDRIPWGRLNLVDLGAGGYREIAPGTEPLRCDDIEINDPIELNGQGLFRTGTVLEKGVNDFPEDGHFFPCMIAASAHVNTGDSGGAVFVRGLPAGVASRSFGGALGFTPLAEGLEQLGLVLCTTPDCDVPRP